MLDLDSITEESLVTKGGRKWSAVPGCLGAFIAEMDFGVADVIRTSLHTLDSRDLFGYAPYDSTTALKAATSAFCAERYGWPVPSEHIELASDVLAAFSGVLRFLTPADTPIILPTPAYMPFFDVAQIEGRELIEVPMIRGDDQWSYDLDAIDAALTPGSTLVLCNPHNPIGKVATEAELRSLAEVVDRNGARVFSDEIHAALVHSPAVHVPYASLSEVTAAHSTTATAASKAFNIPGLKSAQLILTAEADRTIWAQKGSFVTGAASNPGILATTAAYTQGGAWLDEVKEYLLGNRDLLTELVAEHLPKAVLIPAEGTYLAWLDLTAYGIEGELFEFFRDSAKVAITEGRLCGEVGAGHIRFNFALPRPLLREAVERLGRALR